MKEGRGNTKVAVVLVLLLLLIAAALCYVLVSHQTPPTSSSVTTSDAAQYLSAASQAPRQNGFRFRDVPSWLFVHVAIIASCQVLSLLYALHVSRRERLLRQDVKAVQFLCEIPMYLGLFGTLLGVCLTQFITGSLVAPLAYLTTMSGIVLHVFGKLAIWLPLPEGEEGEE